MSNIPGFGPRQSQWLRSLENEEFPQGRKRLRTGNSFCCLGVACNLFNPNLWRPGEVLIQDEEPVTRYTYLAPDEEAAAVLPPSVRDWFGFKNDSGTFAMGVGALTALNDRGVSFSEIAAIVQLNPKAFFSEEK